MDENKSLKSRGEDAAAAYLERVGMRIAERSWSCDAGTVDIVAFDSDVLVVVDVKTTKGCRQGREMGLVDAKRRRAGRLAAAYLAYADLRNVSWRFDEIDLLVIGDDRALLRHHRDALNVDM